MSSGSPGMPSSDVEAMCFVAASVAVWSPGVTLQIGGNLGLSLLELGRLSNPRHGVVDGRSVLLLDYQGDPSIPTRNRFEEVTRCLTATIVVDEADRSVMRVEASFTRDFKIAGGLLVDIRKGTRFTVEQERVQPSLWLPAHMDATGSLRALLFLNFNGSATASYKGYRGLKDEDDLSAHITGARD